MLARGDVTWQGLETLWTVRATYDPARGWLPVEYKADMPRGRGNPKKIEWTMCCYSANAGRIPRAPLGF